MGRACAGNLMPNCGRRHRIGAIVASTSENSSLKKNFFAAKISTLDRMLSSSALTARVVGLRSRPPTISPASEYQSCSMRNSASRNCARVTGSTGISGGCGKRSSRYSMITRESYSTRSRSTSVGTLLYGFRSSKSSGRLPSSTSTMSIVMLFSASTNRARWLHGSVGFENSVITDRRLAMTVMRRVSLTCASGDVPGRLRYVFPDFLLQHEGNQEEHEQEPDDSDAELLPLALDRLADVVEEIHDVANDIVEFPLVELAGAHGLEALEQLDAVLVGGEHGSLRALQWPEHVRHRSPRQHHVIDAGRAVRRDVEAAQERVDVVGAAAARDQR